MTMNKNQYSVYRKQAVNHIDMYSGRCQFFITATSAYKQTYYNVPTCMHVLLWYACTFDHVYKKALWKRLAVVCVA